MDLSLQTGQLSHVLNWQVQLDGLQPGEARNAALGGTVDFTAWGSAGSIQLPAASVAVEQVVALTPESRTMRPGEESLYTVTLMNPAATAMTYDLGLQGLPPEWVTLQATVEVPATGSIDLPLTVRADALASLGEHGFAVTAATAGGARGLAYSRLVLEGTAVIQAEIHGVVITLTPLQDTAGQGTSATYRVRIINTGNVTETYELTGQLPVGIQGLFGETSVTVAPGLNNYREVLLTLTAPPGVAAGGQNFDVTATSTGTSGVTDQAAGTLNVSGFGVDVALTVLAARPDDSTFLMRVTNTGQSQDTFDLSLGGVLAPAATLEITAVTLAAGASRDVTVTVIGIDFAYPGFLDLVVIATSRGDSNVQDRAAAAIDIPQSQGLTVSLDPVEVELPGVGDGAFLVLVQNSGNSEDAYSAAITGTGGAISVASLDGLDGQPTQSIPSFRLPGLATGAILLNVSLSSFGEGTVDVTIHSQSNAQISGTVTARLKTANQNPVADPGADRTIHLGDLVQLDGSNSADPDQGPSSLTYAWSFIAVPPGSVLDDQAIAGANTVSASFTPDLTGQYRVQLIVSDGLLSDSREVAFQVENQVPVADAGPDLSVLIGEALILNGSGSHDPDRDLIRYRWTLAQTPAGSALVQDDIGNAATPEPSFTPDLAGLYELALVVTDGDLESNPDPIRISAYDADLPPQADAGPDRNALVGDQTVVDGSGSYDPDAAPQPLTYRWTFASLPPGSALDDAAISNATSAVASFMPDAAGTYSLDLEVSDGLVQHSDQISVHGYLVETPPNADAGDDTLAGKGIPVSLDAGASSDPDTPAQGLSYAWIFVSIPQGSGLDNADLSNANTATPGFTPDVEGRYVLRLTLSDGTGEDSDNVMVSAKAGTGGDVVGAGGGGFGWLELWLLLAWLGIAGALRGRRRFGQLPVALMLAFLLAGGGLFPRPAQADDGPWYMGVSVGASKSAADAAELDANLAALGYSTTSTLDDTDIGWKLFGGYQWNPNLAVEAALVDLGQVTSRISGNFGDLDAFVADVARVHPYSARGISASIVGELPVAQRFRLFGKVGLFFWDADIDARFEVGGQPISFDSKQGVDPVFGAGMKFHINKKTALRVEWERYEIDRDSVQLFSAGAEYRFP
ncbi:MAG: outer membrane beta-barrel protein [gamma proteobacterium endosymbiont of Lamellibrachia anaximandri]|nr:outer membrane beta-barrel protein [gamma proteobacterium endosymbiont of Lamellibrachia anaximandri]